MTSEDKSILRLASSGSFFFFGTAWRHKQGRRISRPHMARLVSEGLMQPNGRTPKGTRTMAITTAGQQVIGSHLNSRAKPMHQSHGYDFATAVPARAWWVDL